MVDAERQRLIMARDKKIDGVVRRLQKERLETEKTAKIKGEEEKTRLDEVCGGGRGKVLYQPETSEVLFS